MDSNFGDIDLSAILGGAPADSATPAPAEAPAVAQEGADKNMVFDTLDTMDPNAIVDWLKLRKIVPDDFKLPAETDIKLPDSGSGYSDIPAEELAVPPTPVAGTY